MVSIFSRIEPWTVQEVCALLHSFESRLEATAASEGSSEGSQPNLNMVHHSSSLRNDFSPQQNRRGFTGAHRGSSRPPRGGRGSRGYGKLICQLCEKPGHVARKCWHRFEQSFAPQNQNPPYFQQKRIQQTHQPAAHLAQARPQSFTPTPSVAAQLSIAMKGCFNLMVP